MAERTSTYVGALDGLRGLAALVVVFAHTSAAIRMPRATRDALFEGLLSPLVNADGAVHLFFVLSGFVLAGSLSRNRTATDLAAYGVKRVFRIHPPYVAAVLFAWLLSFAYQDSSNATGFLRNLALIHLDLGELLSAMRFPGKAMGQLPVGWSLEVEMIFSFLLPLMLLVSRRLHPLLLLAASVGLLWIDRPLGLALPFALGIIAFENRERLARVVGALPPSAAGVATIVGLLVWTSPSVFGLGEVAAWYRQPTVAAAYGLGSVTLLALSAYRPGLGRWLSVAPVAWLGRVSYSLYLVHFSILLLLALVRRPS